MKNKIIDLKKEKLNKQWNDITDHISKRMEEIKRDRKLIVKSMNPQGYSQGNDGELNHFDSDSGL